MKQLCIALEFKIISDSDFHLLLLHAFIILGAAVLSFIYAVNRKEKLRIVSFFVNSLPPAVMLLYGILFPELAKTLFFTGILYVCFLALTALTPKETNLDRADVKSLVWLWFILFFVISHFVLKEKYEEIYQRFTSDRTHKNTEDRLRKKVEQILERDYKAYVWLEDDRIYEATRTNGNKVYIEVIYRDSAVIRMRQKNFIKALLPADTNTWLGQLNGIRPFLDAYLTENLEGILKYKDYCFVQADYNTYHFPCENPFIKVVDDIINGEIVVELKYMDDTQF